MKRRLASLLHCVADRLDPYLTDRLQMAESRKLDAIERRQRFQRKAEVFSHENIQLRAQIRDLEQKLGVAYAS